MIGANLVTDPYRLPQAVMPLVRLIADGNLSWADKQKCADAILACQRHYDDMMAEARQIADASCAGCAPPSQERSKGSGE